MTRLTLATLGDDGKTPASQLPATVVTAGSVPRNVRHVVAADSPVAAVAGDFVLADATAGTITVNLAASVAGTQTVVKKTDASANTVTVVATIDGASNATLAYQGQGIALEGDGTGYQRVVRQSLATGIVDYPATPDARYVRQDGTGLPASVVAAATLTEPSRTATDGFYPTDAYANLALGSALKSLKPSTALATLTVQWTDSTHFTIQSGGTLSNANNGFVCSGASVGEGAVLTVVDSTHGSIAGTTYSGTLNQNMSLTVQGAHGNTVLGSEGTAGLLTAGWHNVFIGSGVAINATTASGCIGIGDGALNLLTVGIDNAIIGNSAAGALTSGFQNTGLGFGVLNGVTTGNDNTAVGQIALAQSTGNFNTAVGSGALSGASNTAGQNTAIGKDAGAAITTGSFNVLNGYQAGTALTTGASNTASGYGALKTQITTSNSVAVGATALSVSTGGQNTAVGSGAGSAATTGALHVFVGQNAGAKIVAGGQNTHVGAGAGNTASSADVTDSVLVGQGTTAGAGQTTAIGTGASATGRYGTALGRTASAVGQGSVAIGTDSAGTGAAASTANYFVLGTANHKLFIPGLPSADPSVAGQLYTAGAPSAGVPKAVMVSGG